MSQGAIRFLEQFLSPRDIGIEFGSGRSTMWFGARTKYLVSVEHSEEWYGKVKEQIKNNHRENIEYLYIALQENLEEPVWGIYKETPKYVDIVNRYEEEFFDYVIVDGAYRVHCLKDSLPKIKVGGILILDNSNWLPSEKWGIPSEFRVIHRSENVKSETTVFLKTAINSSEDTSGKRSPPPSAPQQ